MKSIIRTPDKRIRISDFIEASTTDLLAAVRQHDLEGIVGKKKGSVYQPGKRSGAWIKRRVNQGQELVVGGYRPGAHGIDAVIVGYYRGNGLDMSQRFEMDLSMQHAVSYSQSCLFDHPEVSFCESS